MMVQSSVSCVQVCACRYRLCVRAKVDTIEVEMELRKSSTYGKVNPKTGHVPSLEEVEIHAEIRNLYDKEDDAEVLAEEESIKDEDFRTTHEQLRVLERVYHDIIERQLEERRAWGWRTIHNKHLYSHMVMGNLLLNEIYHHIGHYWNFNSAIDSYLFWSHAV